MAKTKLQSLVSIEAARSVWDKVITTTPVVLTVIATVLAGLSSSEVGLAQYHRALSAQNQAKAADQWAFYQAKRTRQEEADNTRSLLASMTGSTVAGPDAAARLVKAWGELSSQSATMPNNRQSADLGKAIQKIAHDRDSAELAKYLSAGVPTVQDQPLAEPEVESTMDMIAKNVDAAKIEEKAKTLNGAAIADALAKAQANSDAFDDATKPITSFIAHLSALATTLSASSGSAPSAKSLADDLTASTLSWNSRRDTAEAKYNQTIAQIIEVQVAYTSQDSDRHRDRGKFFFYGMLAMQAGVTMSTLSLAVKNRNALWVAAALVGMGAVAYAGYIYLFT